MNAMEPVIIGNATSDGLIYAISIFFFRNKPAAYPFTDADIPLLYHKRKEQKARKSS